MTRGTRTRRLVIVPGADGRFGDDFPPILGQVEPADADAVRAAMHAISIEQDDGTRRMQFTRGWRMKSSTAAVEDLQRLLDRANTEGDIAITASIWPFMDYERAPTTPFGLMMLRVIEVLGRGDGTLITCEHCGALFERGQAPHATLCSRRCKVARATGKPSLLEEG